MDASKKAGWITFAAVLCGIAGAIAALSVQGPLGPGAIVLALPLVIGAGLLFAWAKAIQRAAEVAKWRAFCAERGWTYRDRDAHERPEAWTGAPPFGQGQRRRALDIVAGVQAGIPFEAWTYEYTQKQGKSSRTYAHQVLIVEMPANVPGLVIQAETFGHRVMDAFGGGDIDVESAEFSKAFRVTCPDRRLAYDILHPRTIEYLLHHGPRRTWHWKGNRLLLVAAGRMRREGVLSLWPLANGLRELTPRHLVAKQARS